MSGTKKNERGPISYPGDLLDPRFHLSLFSSSALAGEIYHCTTWEALVLLQEQQEQLGLRMDKECQKQSEGGRREAQEEGGYVYL